jgi:aminoglycoside phosphotransferase (APT) family kinase protein
MAAPRHELTATVAPTEEFVRGWLTDNVGRVVSVTRQVRWRPIWFADVERDGQTLELCVRGERTDSALAFPLRHEMSFQQVLFEHGIPVPKVHGWSDSPAFYVMDRVAGLPESEPCTGAERQRVVDEYLQVLVRMHQLDLQPFVDAGITRAARPEDSALPGLAALEAIYRGSKVRPDPLVEWGLGWLHRNPVMNVSGRESAVVWDSGQFHHSGGRLLALMDLELGHIGDPMMDLTGWRLRDTTVHYGDFEELYARYEELGGARVDREAIRWHQFAFALCNQFFFHQALVDPPLESAYMNNLQICLESNRMAVETLAEGWGIDLDELPVPEPELSPVATAHAHLVASLRHLPTTDAHAAWAVRLAFRAARHLQRFDEIGTQVVAADLDDLEHLLGDRPGSWLEGDHLLEEYVLADDGAQDVELLHLFNRRLQRAHMLLGPIGSAMATHLRVQPLPTS